VQAWTEKDDKKRINPAISTAIAYFGFLLHRKRRAKIMTIMITDVQTHKSTEGSFTRADGKFEG
jgi:hypothetical protein